MINSGLKNGIFTLCFTLVSMAISLSISAESVRVPAGQQGGDYSVPSNGQTKMNVEQAHGSPMRRDGPTGVPPIYYWEYQDFTVYFEGDRVIHTVRKPRGQ